MNPAPPLGLGAIDWSRPWLAGWRARGEPLAEDARRTGLVAALNRANDGGDAWRPAAAVTFVDQSALPAGEGYESFIARTACVPTRPNLHDFFNGLAWLVHPALKRRLNQLQAQAIAQRGPGSTRGALRDALTLFDENAALWRAPARLTDALRRRDWHALFVTHRAAWAEARVDLFGHALIEKLVSPRKAITAHVWVLPERVGDATAASRWLADELESGLLDSKPFLPLPVLGVPGWWPANEAAGFYLDDSVFRVAQKKTAADGPLS